MHREWESSSAFPLGAARWKEDARQHSGRYNKYNFFFAVRLFFSAVAMDVYLSVEQNRVWPLLNAKCVLPTCALERLRLFYLSRCALGHCCSVCTLYGPQVKFTKENREECDHRWIDVWDGKGPEPSDTAARQLWPQNLGSGFWSNLSLRSP